MAVICEIKVVPQSGKQQWAIEPSGLIKVFLKSPPEDNKANHELIGFIAKSLKLRKDQVRIVSGLTSRRKRVEIDGLQSLQELYTKLGFEEQKSCF